MRSLLLSLLISCGGGTAAFAPVSVVVDARSYSGLLGAVSLVVHDGGLPDGGRTWGANLSAPDGGVYFGVPQEVSVGGRVTLVASGSRDCSDTHEVGPRGFVVTLEISACTFSYAE